MPLTEKELLERDAKRNIGQELLEAIIDVKAGRHGHTHSMPITKAAEARGKTGLSQPKFAQLLGVSVRTLQEWEQGRRSPSGAARSLLHIAMLRPDVFREVGQSHSHKMSRQCRCDTLPSRLSFARRCNISERAWRPAPRKAQ